MKNKIILGSYVIASAGLLLIPSCSKDNSGSISSKDVVAAQDEIYADALYEEVDNTVVSSITTLDLSDFQISI